MKVAFYTLGCKVNQYETTAMEQELVRRGHTLTAFDQSADVYVVNTCSVTAVSDQKSRQTIRRAKKLNPDAVVAVCGCYPQTHADEVRALGVDVLGGTGDRAGFLDLLEASVKTHQPQEAIDQSFERRVFEVLTPGGGGTRTRAMLKVEDGCVNFCSYCIIPYARGPVRSLALDKAVTQAQALRTQGYQEIVLTGIEISSWGKDLQGDLTLIDLVEAICLAIPQVRIRLGSLEPRTITEDFCTRAKRLQNLCPQFHLSMQSGCDETLKAMNRKYDSGRYFQSVTLLNQHFHRPAITTDLIVGFPEETEAHFAKTLAFIEKCQFASMHIFPYSIRPGTPAAERPQVEKAAKDVRAKQAAAVAETMESAYLQGCVGQCYQVLFEQEREGGFVGHAPNYTQVWVDSQADLHNQIHAVEIVAVKDGRLVGKLKTKSE
ncbi:tRNA (N(6)-L-threonylcarbamoyladenosine(37)-C(2))-methylthiotransferase MtaB [Bengtsoniella intestinalis]|uniref:tRNA (N(6)-L-threonylcarbamoyladenosine(37)-C(2))- methylthiotransferase MtaB n=1 Tax=Bengtsoniella intestinalis TaxID=3073143 RepID=UPI00391F7882